MWLAWQRMVGTLVLLAVLVGAGWLVYRQFGVTGELASALDHSTPPSDDREWKAWDERVRAALDRVGPSTPDAIPILTHAMRTSPSRTQAFAADALGRIGPPAVPALTEVLQARAAGVSLDPVARAIGRIGQAAAPAVPALIELVPQAAAVETLGRIGPSAAAAVPALTAALREAKDDASRWAAAGALGGIGPPAAPAVPALLVAGKAAEANGQMVVAAALGRIGSDAAAALPWLRDVFTSTNNADLRLTAAVALARIDPERVSDAAPLLIALWKDRDSSAVRRSLDSFGTLGAAAVPPLVVELRGTDALHRRRAAQALTRIGPAATAALPALAAVQADRDPGLRYRAAEAVRRIEGTTAGDWWLAGTATGLVAGAVVIAAVLLAWPGRRRVLAGLALAMLIVLGLGIARMEARRAALAEIAAMPDEGFDRMLRRRAMTEAVKPLGWTDFRAVPVLIGLLDDANEDVRRSAAAGLGQLGWAARPAVPALVALFEEPVGSYSEGARVAAHDALIRLGPTAREAAPHFAAALVGEVQGPRRYELVRVLSAIGPVSPEVVPALFTALRDPDVTGLAAAGLKAMGYDPVPALCMLLVDRDPAARRAAVAAVDTLRPVAAGAVPALEAVARSDPALADAARNTIAHITSPAPDRQGRLNDPWTFVAGGAAALALAGLARLLLRRRQEGRLEAARRERQLRTERHVARFLESGDPDRAWEFLRLHPDATPRQQCNVLLVEQAARWRAGYPRTVRDYLEHFPAVAAESDLVLDLVVGDYRCARAHGIAIDRQAILVRYPALGDRLARRLEAIDGVPARESAATEPDTASVLPSVNRTVTERPMVPQPGTVDYTPQSSDDAVGPATAAHVPAPSLAAESLLTGAAGHPAEPNLTTPYAGSPPVLPDTAGAAARIGRYTVERVLGTGAFGTVYLALDEQLQRQVAVKLPRRSRRAEAAVLEAFLIEARVLAGLDHPAIVPVYDVGRTEDERFYVVSKYVPGSDLARWLARGPVPPTEAALLVARVAEALDYAHGKGLLHRDVKPANLLLDRQGNIFVADFGLALALEDPGPDGQVAGTPAYMSPEQARGEVSRLDGRSDLFSLGVVLYELLTGRRPFTSSDRLRLLEAICMQAPTPPHVAALRVPAELSRICMRCLAKDPEQRFADAGKLALELRRWERGAAASAGAAFPVNRIGRRIVEQCLQPFDGGDAMLYQELLPGAHGDELPAGMSLWHAWAEATDPVAAPALGLLHGAAGVGKTSFVQAGLLPRLDDEFLCICVALKPGDTDAHVLAALWKAVPALQGVRLADAFTRLRDGRLPGSTRRVLVVLDQFEEWLSADHPADAELCQALRSCDGIRVRCLLVVQNHARAAAEAFLDRLGTPVRSGVNAAELEPFDGSHALRVLIRFGQALGRLPDDPAAFTAEQQRFLGAAIAGLTQQGRVTALRLARFVRHFRELAWTPTACSRHGQTACSAGSLLQDALTTVPESERARLIDAARPVLKALLPAAGTGKVPALTRAEAELLMPPDMVGSADALLELLVREMRLLTPVEGAAGRRDAAYRLVDEEAVDAVRRWLPVKRKPGRTSSRDPAADTEALGPRAREPQMRRAPREPLPLLKVAGLFAVVLAWGAFVYYSDTVGTWLSMIDINWAGPMLVGCGACALTGFLAGRLLRRE